MPFPDQVDRLVLSIEQAERLTSRVRSDVFWAFSAVIPMSVAAVAKSLGKSAQTVHYHVNELFGVGLLVAAGTRQSRSRTETLYIHKGLVTVDQGAKGTPEHNAMRSKSFRFTTKTLVEETEALYDVVNVDPSRYAHNVLVRDNLYLTAEQSLRLRDRLRSLIAELEREQPAEGGARTHVMFYARPTVGQSRAWKAQATGEPEPTEYEEDDEE